MDAKLLILKGLGKAKVRNIIKQFLFHSFNEYLDYQSGGLFSLHLGGIVDGFGLPEMPDDDYFTLEELTEFIGGKI